MRFILCFLLSFSILPLFAGTPEGKAIESKAEVADFSSGTGFLSHLSIGLRMSTLGIGVQAATPVNDYFNLRAGFDVLSFKTGNIDMGLDDPNEKFYDAFGYTPEYKMKASIEFFNGNILLDYHPTKGIFHLTGGIYIGNNKLKARGDLVDGNGKPVVLPTEDIEWPTLNFDGHQLVLDGTNLNANAKMGGLIKPYLGMGIGRAIGKDNRLSFKFELGAIYQGSYELTQEGRKVSTNSGNDVHFEDVGTYTRWLKWWPMMNFQLSYTLF